jgi:hypothetical protein
MRRNIVIIGIVISTIAAFMLIIGIADLRNAAYSQLFNFTNSGKYNSQINIYGAIGSIGFILLFVGIPMAIISAVLKSEEPKKIQPVVIPQPIQTPSSSQQVATQQPTNDSIKVEVTSRGKSMFDRDTFLGSIMAIGIGIVILILIIWIEPLIKNIVDYQWILLVIRIAGAVFILIGVVGIIAAFLPKKEEIQIEQVQK